MLSEMEKECLFVKSENVYQFQWKESFWKETKNNGRWLDY